MGADRYHWELVSDGDTATRALNADERLELERLREMRRQVDLVMDEMQSTRTGGRWFALLGDIVDRSRP